VNTVGLSEDPVNTATITDVLTLGTSTFTLTEAYTAGVTCSFSWSTPSATGSATPVPVPIGECIGVGVGYPITPSATVSLYTNTYSVIGRPLTSVVFDVATLSQGSSGNSNDSRRSHDAAGFSLSLTVVGVVVGCAMVLI
jgi:hypothetical protein